MFANKIEKNILNFFCLLWIASKHLLYLYIKLLIFFTILNFYITTQVKDHFSYVKLVWSTNYIYLQMKYLWFIDLVFNSVTLLFFYQPNFLTIFFQLKNHVQNS